MESNNIKLSKIELEAFRGYRDKVIFDFKLPENKIADIIAIYAPNGFGKTSFFDGVEWNTKGRIERFEENTKIRNAAKEFGGSILKNRESFLEQGTVSVFDVNNFFFTRCTSKSENGDLLAGTIESKSNSPIKNIGKYKDFKKIEILPQSRIDSFLSSNTPEEKYQALLDFWDGNDESDYFVGVSKFYEESEKERGNIIDNIQKLTNKIAELTTSESRISFFNSLVKEINSKVSNTPTIQEFNEQTSDIEFESIVRAINNNTASISSRLEQTESRQVHLVALEEGLALYIKNNELILILSNDIKGLQSTINNFQQLETKQVEQKRLDAKLQKEQTDLDEIKLIFSSKEDFSAIVSQIGGLVNERNNITGEKPILIQQKNSTEKDLKSKTDRLKSLLDNEIKYNDNFERLADVFKAIEANRKRIESSNNRLSLSKTIKEARSNLALAIRNELNIIQSLLFLKLESFYSTEYTYGGFKELASEIKNEFKIIVSLNDTLKELRSEYNKKGSLNENLQKIIELGKDFISRTETNTCPLCNTPQDDFERLLSCISSQKEDALSLNQSFEKIQSLELDIKKATDILEEKYESLLTKLRQTLSELTDRLSTINSKILGTEALINYYSVIDTLFESENKRLRAQYDAIESENGLLKLQLEDLDNLKESLAQSITESEKKFEELKEKITGSDHHVEETEAKMELLRQNPQYIRVNSFLEKKTIPQSDYLEAGLEKMIRETEGNIQKLREQIASLQVQTDDLTKSIEGKNKDDIEKDLTEKITKLNDIEAKVAQYKSQYKSITGRDELTIDIIRQNLSDNKNFIQNLKDVDVKIRELQANIQVMQQNIELNKLKNEYKEKQKQLKALEEATEKLRTLKGELSDFLIQKINSVLNQEIINDIYKKIDPHPDFKTIKLIPQFDGVKPKLFIKAVNEESNDEIDPILYLSSAQVNILSLSIFLAKALQNKDVMVNTIFMDDPIQYLDSINVLSFIDLLRSITADKQLDRQVVISTHDENFFNLLKKKFDPEYYKAKFIEFESYGKLKTN
ncbi:AAA family ATPase [Chitinophaga sp. GbtcB8]|uniref:AAA family ATPase n=1 Tax=Chitinophaga sp. GbtcB8 TaxID=2824753 RepID=UPI001C30DD8A|nr:AAA family ATPase [Chitinophaga sp. GbtcB8]